MIAITMNHTPMIGPNSRPTKAVPFFWMKKSPIRITTVRGTTTLSMCVEYTLRPSIALKTEIAGVMAPSPYSSVAPTSPITTMMARRRLWRAR
jgi:hypothetical protein